MTTKHNTSISKEMWGKVDHQSKALQNISRPSLTYWQDAWHRLRKNPMAMIGLVTILFIVLIAIFYPMVSTYSFSDQDLRFASIPPRIALYQIDDTSYIHIGSGLKVYTVTKDGELLDQLIPVKDDVMKRRKVFDINGNNVVIDYSEQPYKLLNEKGEAYPYYKKVFNKTYRLGTDSLGRDMLIRVVSGARISLAIAAVASLVNLVIGTLYGGIAGYAGGRVDNIMMRIVDIISTVPLMLYLILFMIVLGSGLQTIMLTFGLVFWVRMARIVRGQIISLKKQEYVMAARTIGASNKRILLKHLLPNAMGPIIVALTMMIPNAIFTEAFLSFIGLGVSPPVASWGTLANDALSGYRSYPHQLFFPSLAICITMLAFNFLGDGLRDALDPRLRK